jgi:hypothetical protein
MDVNSNPTAFKQKKKKLHVSKLFPLISFVIDATITFEYLCEIFLIIRNGPNRKKD